MRDSTFTIDQIAKLREIERARMRRGEPGLREELQTLISRLQSSTSLEAQIERIDSNMERIYAAVAESKGPVAEGCDAESVIQRSEAARRAAADKLAAHAASLRPGRPPSAAVFQRTLGNLPSGREPGEARERGLAPRWGEFSKRRG